MFSRSTSPPRSRVCALLLLSVACLSPLSAQKPPTKVSGPAYDLKTEVTIKGIVDDVRLVGADAKTKVTRLVVKSGAQVNEFFLCPQSFLDDMGVSYAKGDELEITGSKVKHDDQEEILVRKVVKGNDSLVLRDEKGKPYWN